MVRALVLLPWRVFLLWVLAVTSMRLLYWATGVPQFVPDLVIEGQPQSELILGSLWQRWPLLLLMALLGEMVARARGSSRIWFTLYVCGSVMAEMWLRRASLTRGLWLYPLGFGILSVISFVVPVLITAGLSWPWLARARTLGALPRPLWRWLAFAALAASVLTAVSMAAADSSLLKALSFPGLLLGDAIWRATGRLALWKATVPIGTWVYYAAAVLSCGSDLSRFRSDSSGVPSGSPRFTTAGEHA